MSDSAFFDTNVDKRLIARKLLFEHYRAGTSAISTQVLAEFFQNYVAKLRMPYVAALKEMHCMCACRVVEQTISLLFAGTTIYQRHSLSFWDSMILAAAKEARATILYTEDMNHGQEVEGVLITNPFAAQTEECVSAAPRQRNDFT